LIGGSELIDSLLACTVLIFYLASAVALMSPAEPLRGQLHAAIWHDLLVNAMIGNGNGLASLWYNAGSDGVSDLHIGQLECSKVPAGQRCAFQLFRDGGPATAFGETAPDKLQCDAMFIMQKDGWAVRHTPPRKAGHSKTSMRCKVLTH
jgi:hypothetical protein